MPAAFIPMVGQEFRFAPGQWTRRAGFGITPGISTTPKPSSVESAEVGGLCYVTDEQPGIQRERIGTGFRYRDIQGRVVRDRRVLRRIEALVIPPAWEDVWICPAANGHVQATGRDERGRKQHRYHDRWHEVRDQTKFERLTDFARALPAIRRRIARDLARRGLCREKVLGTVVRLLEVSLIRIGNAEYARANQSFGLTTLRDRHARIRGAKVEFQFRGKSGKDHTVRINDRRLAGIVRQCQELPGQELFQYIDDFGEKRDVDSGAVNDYLREISGRDFTAKSFRTWMATVGAAAELVKLGPFTSEFRARRNLNAAVKATSLALGNTPAVCRKSYIHPLILSSYLDGSLLPELEAATRKAPAASTPRGLRTEEAAVLRFLERNNGSSRPRARR